MFIIGILLGIGLYFWATSRVKIENQKAAKFGEFSFPRAGYGSATPLIFGRYRQDSPIVLDYGAFRSEPITQKIKTGLFGSKKQTIAHKYFFTIALMTALGPGVRLKRIWANSNELVWEGDLADGGEIIIDKEDLFGGDKEGGGLAGKIRFYSGSFDQDQDQALIDLRGADVPSYGGTSYAVFEDFYIGTGTTPPTFSFEIERIPSVISGTDLDATMPGGQDFNPISAIIDAMTMRWGGFGTDVSAFDMASFIRDAGTVRNEGTEKTRGFSQIVQQSVSAEDMIEEMMSHVDGIIFEDPETGLISSKLLRFDYDVDDIPHLTDEDIIEIGEYNKSTWESTVNTVRVTFKDRNADYNESVASTPDFALINSQRRVRSSDKTMTSVTSAEGAQYLSARDLGYGNVPLISCSIKTKRTAYGMRPGDVIRVTFTKGFSLNNIVFRVLKIGYGTLKDGEITLKLIQDRFSSHIGSFASPDQSSFVPPDTEARNIVSYRVMTAPHFMANEGEALSSYENNAKLMFIAEKPGSGSQSYDVYQSYSAVSSSSEAIGEEMAYSAIGTLASAYNASEANATRRDTTGVIKITGLSSYERGMITASSSIDDVRDGSSMMMINDELFMCVNPSFDASGDLTFGTVYRAMLDTAPQSHAAGSAVVFIFGKTGLTGGVEAGRTSNLKAVDKSISQRYPLSSAPTIPVSVSDRASRPLPPGDVRINGSRTPSNTASSAGISVSWKNRSRTDASLRAYDEAGVAYEPNTKIRIRWSVGGGSMTTILATGSSHSINTDGMSGTVTVIVDAYNDDTSKASSVSETFIYSMTE